MKASANLLLSSVASTQIIATVHIRVACKKGRHPSYLQSNDSVEGKHAAFEDVPCFLPVVPRTTSCKPDLFQQIEYLTKDKCQLKCFQQNNDAYSKKGKGPAHKATNPILPASQRWYISRNLLKLFRWNRCLKKLWLQTDRIHCHREITGRIRNKGTPTVLNLKEAGNLLDREDKRALRTFSILFSIENPSGAPSGNCPIVMVVKYKGSSMWDSNAPVEECKGKRIYPS